MPDPYLTVTGLPSSIDQNQQFTFTVTAYHGDGTIRTDETALIIMSIHGLDPFSSDDPGLGIVVDSSFTAGIYPGGFGTAPNAWYYYFQPSDAGVHEFTGFFTQSGSLAITAFTAFYDPYPVQPNGTSASVTVTAAAHVTLSPVGATATASAPGPVAIPQTITVLAQDSAGATDTGYTGTVAITSSDPTATLPADYTYTGPDAGTHDFSVTYGTAGQWWVVYAHDAVSGVWGWTWALVSAYSPPAPPALGSGTTTTSVQLSSLASWILVGPPTARSASLDEPLTVVWPDASVDTIPAHLPAYLPDGSTVFDSTTQTWVLHCVQGENLLRIAPESAFLA